MSDGTSVGFCDDKERRYSFSWPTIDSINSPNGLVTYSKFFLAKSTAEKGSQQWLQECFKSKIENVSSLGPVRTEL
jgi:hypothetical protein